MIFDKFTLTNDQNTCITYDTLFSMTLDVTEKLHTFSASFSQSMVNIFIKYITETVKEPTIMPHQAPRREIV